MKVIITWISIAAGCTAAGLWWWASVLIVPPRPAGAADDSGWDSAAIIETDPFGREIDSLATMKKQSRVNAWAAGFAGLAAACQAIAQMMPDTA